MCCTLIARAAEAAPRLPAAKMRNSCSNCGSCGWAEPKRKSAACEKTWERQHGGMRNQTIDVQASGKHDTPQDLAYAYQGACILPFKVQQQPAG